MAEAVSIYEPSEAKGRVRQGEVVSNVVVCQVELATLDSMARPVVDQVKHPWAIVVSQDCDLERDFEARKEERSPAGQLSTILFCQAHSVEQARQDGIKAAMWRSVRSNQQERYHYLREVSPADDAAADGVPALVVDFRRYFAVPVAEVYERVLKDAQRRCRLRSPYLEHFTTRFCYYQFRVALPEDHWSKPEAELGRA